MAFADTIRQMSVGEPTSSIMRKTALLVNNRHLFFRKFGAKLNSVRRLPGSPVQKRVNGVLFDFDLDYDRWIKAMYLGNYEVESVQLMRKLLSQGDTFIDVGANIGYLTAIGAGFVGKTGQVHSFEPVPRYFQKLSEMAALNPDYRIIVNQSALGEEEGDAEICIADPESSDIGWDTMVKGHLPNEIQKKKTEVSVYRLDNYILKKGLESISLIKIDTEGFEFPVLRGLEGYFRASNHRPAILCEIIPSAYPALGYTLAQLSEYMKQYGYCAFSLFDTCVGFDIEELTNITSVLFRAREV
ncbi:FkbM family methyltransferase [Candidatus Poribacteria bacterium]